MCDESPVLRQTEDATIHIALVKLDDHSANGRKVVTDLVISGLEDVDELVELHDREREHSTIAQEVASLIQTRPLNEGGLPELKKPAMPSNQPR